VKKPPLAQPVVKTRRDFLGAGTRLAVAASLSAGTLGAFVREARAATAPVIDAQSVAPGFTVLSGAGCNVLAIAGPEGALLVDGGYKRNSADLLAAVAKATGTRKVNTLINTHWHPAQTGSNEIVGKQGALIVSHEVTRLYLSRPVASIDYTGLYGPLTEKGRPKLTTRTTATLEFAGHPLEYGYLPAAHTNGDLYIHFPDAKLMVAGGPVCSESWPLLDWRNGAWLGGLVKAHEKLLSLVKPDTRIVPATGRVIDVTELRRHHQMYAAFHEKMVLFQNKGYDSGDCIAQRPLREFEPIFGDPAAFIQGSFQSLNLAYSPD
jgi:glyoxylase-like metal-dependent hydrolase (beta-lactamase superfamily II)